MSDAQTTKANVLISLAALVVIIYGMQAASKLIVPFLVAAFLALISIRPMLWMQRDESLLAKLRLNRKCRR